MAAQPDSPGVVIFPPLLMVLSIAAALALNWLLPQRIADHAAALGVGIGIVVAGIALVIWGKKCMDAAGTNVRPSQPTTAIVTSGPYGTSRNPIYLAQGLILLGVTVACGTWWGFVTMIPAAFVLHYGIILREERYLERKFGTVYLDYKNKVRRYL